MSKTPNAREKHRGPASVKVAPVVWFHRLGKSVALMLTLLMVSMITTVFWRIRNGGADSTNSQRAFRLEDEKSAFSAYGGSESCRECHQEAFALWRQSNHGLAERSLSPEQDQQAFDPPRSFHHGTQNTSARWQSGAKVTAVGLTGKPEAHRVERVIGNDPLRQFLVPAPGGRLQTLEASFDPHRGEWFNVFGDEDRKPGEWGHWTGRGMNWNSMCAACHNTRLRKNYGEAADTYRTTMAEMSVGCEACHGPLKTHNDWQKQFAKSGRKDPTLTRLTSAQTLDYCGTCHARRVELTGDFKPGDTFTDHFDLAMVDYTDTFHADGQVRDEDYEFAPFLGSKMHARGVTCTDCHNPHSAKTILPGNWLCMRCHNGSYTNATVIDPVAHSHHKVFGYDTNGTLLNVDITKYNPREISETGGECVNCHMPRTAYMQRHWRHDHGFTIPDPLLTKQHGIPNACNRCHKDKDVDWSIQWSEKWYGEKMNRPSRARAQWIARARAGDPAARDALLQLLSTEQIPYWRAVVAGMLTPWIGEPPVRDALFRSLNDTNAFVRAASVRALTPLAETDVPGVNEPVRLHLNDPARNVRVAAAWALRAVTDSSLTAAGELRHQLDQIADQPVGQMQKGAYHFARNEPELALAHLQKAVAWDTNSPAFREQLAVALSALNRTQEAVEQLQEASRRSPQDAEIHFKLGLAWNELGNIGQTIAGLEKAVALEPRHARAWYNLGLAQNVAGQPAEAIQSLLRAESIVPTDARISYARATIHARLGQVEQSRQALQRALEIQPSFPDAHNLLNELSR